MMKNEKETRSADAQQTQKVSDIPAENDNWLDEFLASPELKDELGPDEQAVNSAGLTHPSDAELEKIIEEAMAEVVEEPAEEAPPQQPEEFHDAEYRDAFGEGESLEAAFKNNKPASRRRKTDKNQTPIRKKRPKMKKGYGLLGIPHIIATVIWVMLIVAIGVSFGRMIWVAAADVLAFGRESQSVTITIDEDDTIDTIARKLKDAELIRYPELFKLYADLSHAENKISVGTFTMNTSHDYMAHVNCMTAYSSAREVVEDLMIPEGYTCAQIFALLEEKGVCTVAELEDYAANGELGYYGADGFEGYWFLEGVERGDKYCLEGYLFPDTYDFYSNDDPERVLEKMLDNFDYRFSDRMQAKLVEFNDRLTSQLKSEGFTAEYIENAQMDVRDIVILASLIEKETATVQESYAISGVIFNRLTEASFAPFLNIDAALVYALGKDKLTEADKQVDTPYNTYMYQGLVPGPIANPGLNSLDAALDPDDSNYFYYALDPDTHVHHFSRTYDEHQRFLASIG